GSAGVLVDPVAPAAPGRLAAAAVAGAGLPAESGGLAGIRAQPARRRPATDGGGRPGADAGAMGPWPATAAHPDPSGGEQPGHRGLEPFAYDPTWPDRNWLAELGDNRSDRLHDVSLVTLLLQVLCLPLLALGKWTWRTPAGVVPVYKVLPLLVTVTALFALGV